MVVTHVLALKLHFKQYFLPVLNSIFCLFYVGYPTTTTNFNMLTLLTFKKRRATFFPILILRPFIAVILMEWPVPALLTPSTPLCLLHGSGYSCHCHSSHQIALYLLITNPGVIFSSLCLLLFFSMISFAFPPVSQPLWLFLASLPCSPWWHRLLAFLFHRGLPLLLPLLRCCCSGLHLCRDPSPCLWAGFPG